MAFLELYMQTNGSDFNAGTDQTTPSTTISGTTSLNTTSGVLTFTAGSTGAFTGISTGAWVALSNSSDTIARFTGTIVTIDGTNTIITIQCGTVSPYYSSVGLGAANGLTGTVNCVIGGAWASFNITNTNGCMNGTTPSLSGALTASTYNGLRVNVKAGNYSFSPAANISLPTGLAAKPIWWRGYYSTIGDIDNCANVSGVLVAPAGQTAAPSGATRPQITFTTAYGFAAGAYNWFDSIEVTSSGTAMAGGTVSRFTRCRFTTTSTSTNALTGNSSVLVGCLITALSGGTASGWLGIGNAIGCVFRTGSGGVGIYTLGSSNIIFCVFEGSGNGIFLSGQPNVILNNAFYNCGSGIQVQSGSGGINLIVNNIFSNNRSYGVQLVLSPSQSYLINNDFFSNTSGNVYNLFENYQVGAITTESATPFVNTGTRDYSLTSTSLARQAGFPGQLEL